ncbi:MAG: hypothetical protein WHU94_14115 [Thermogemmata sp.]|jgi:hypothetical protein
MPDRQELFLGGGEHTLYSDEVWYLVTTGGADEVVLEVRFQSDAPDRTGYPFWVGTDVCVGRTVGEAIGRVRYSGAAELLAAVRPWFVPAGIWAKAAEECRKRVPPSEG